MSEEEKSIIDFLKKCKENKDKVIPLLQQSNEILLNYIDKLNNQLQQKENIIKEVREYIKKHSQMTNLQINGIENVLSFRGSVEELLEILDKEVN